MAIQRALGRVKTPTRLFLRRQQSQAEATPVRERLGAVALVTMVPSEEPGASKTVVFTGMDKQVPWTVLWSWTVS